MSSFRTIELSNPNYESDGLRFLTVKTNHLQGRGDICLYVPTLEEHLSNLPIYILLHGVYGSAWVWALKGGAHRVAQKLMEQRVIRPAIIAMPSDGGWGDGSAYFSHHGKQFDQWIAEDVPLAIRENIPEAGIDAPLCIGGLSMGGYGALMLGAQYPNQFRAISAHSSITQLREMALFAEEPFETYSRSATLPDVIDAIRRNQEKLPAIRFDCGKSDPLISGNRQLHQDLLDLDIDHLYEEFPGAHEWSYWNKHVADSYRFFDGVLYS